MTMPQPLVEVQPFEYKILEEKSKNPEVLLTLEGRFQRANKTNANNRVYPLPLWNKLMGHKDLNSKIKNRGMVGELDHPKDGVSSSERVSHVVTEHKLMPNGEVRGVMEILNTPLGQIANTLFRAKVQLGVSSRGDGSLEAKDGVDEVQEDYMLDTYDLVLKPSTAGAYPKIVAESIQSAANSALIASALHNLVKSTEELDVLLECYNIVNVLEGCESRCGSILKDLKLKLAGLRESKEGNTKDLAKQEETLDMANNKDKSPETTPEMAAFLKEQVDRGIAEAVKEKDDEIAKLNQLIVDGTSKKEELTTRCTEAEGKAKKLEVEVETLTEVSEKYEVLQPRYDAAVQLLDEATNRLPEIGELSVRLEAAEQLLAASVDKHKQSAVAEAIKEVTKGLSEDVMKKMSPLMSECESAADVKSRFEEINSLIEMKPKVEKEPLPGQSENSITEQETTHEQVKNPIVQKLLSRMSGVRL